MADVPQFVGNLKLISPDCVCIEIYCFILGIVHALYAHCMYSRAVDHMHVRLMVRG